MNDLKYNEADMKDAKDEIARLTAEVKHERGHKESYLQVLEELLGKHACSNPIAMADALQKLKDE